MLPFRFIYTPGEPAGIGPDLIIQLAQQNLFSNYLVVADPELLITRAKILNLPLEIKLFNPAKPDVSAKSSEIMVWPVPLKSSVKPGELNVANAHYVLETLKIAMNACLNKQAHALVTGPVHKGVIAESGLKFSGHTEFFAEATQSEVLMLLVAQQLRVALATTHIPLRDVPDAINTDLLLKKIWLLNSGLKEYFGLSHPKILVAGLNPHAGENGYLGQEEITIISPAIQQLQAEGISVKGPLSADTLFVSESLKKADAIMAMYHDQGLPVLKHAGFHQAVNITLGLPFIRTSVDHGTALHLAGTGQANTGSLKAAIELAEQISHLKFKV